MRCAALDLPMDPSPSDTWQAMIDAAIAEAALPKQTIKTISLKGVTVEAAEQLAKALDGVPRTFKLGDGTFLARISRVEIKQGGGAEVELHIADDFGVQPVGPVLNIDLPDA